MNYCEFHHECKHSTIQFSVKWRIFSFFATGKRVYRDSFRKE